MNDAAKLLDATLQEESKTDSDLTKLADASANDRAKARRLSQNDPEIPLSSPGRFSILQDN